MWGVRAAWAKGTSYTALSNAEADLGRRDVRQVIVVALIMTARALALEEDGP